MSGTIATKDELLSVAKDTVANFDELREAINSHAMIMELHRYLLEKFIPLPLLEAACNEFYEHKMQEINAARS